jgi:hypothetical protein
MQLISRIRGKYAGLILVPARVLIKPGLHSSSVPRRGSCPDHEVVRVADPGSAGCSAILMLAVVEGVIDPVVGGGFPAVDAPGIDA